MEVRLLKDVLRQLAGVLLRQRLRLEALQRAQHGTPTTPRIIIQPYMGGPIVPRVLPPSSPASGLPVGWSVDDGLLRAPRMAPPPGLPQPIFMDAPDSSAPPPMLDSLDSMVPSRAGSSGRSLLRPLSVGPGLSAAASLAARGTSSDECDQRQC